jgi:hypothetical protein
VIERVAVIHITRRVEDGSFFVERISKAQHAAVITQFLAAEAKACGVFETCSNQIAK